MNYRPFAAERFGGVNFAADPGEVGPEAAVDLLNVDLDRPGRVRVRDGFNNFTSAAAGGRYGDLAYFTTTTLYSDPQIVASRRSGTTVTFDALDASGVSIAATTDTIGATDPYFMGSVRFGGPSAEAMYVVATSFLPYSTIPSPTAVHKWSGTVWSAPAGFPSSCYLLGLQPTDNRVVAAGPTAFTSGSRLNFSGAGTPETFGANDYVDMTPGDGGSITAISNFQGLLFVFKNSGRFFVFTGNSTGGTGDPVFNYRTVDGTGCTAISGATEARDGVYFLNDRGVYRTRGGQAELVSGVLDPIFRGVDMTNVSAINQDWLPFAKIAYHDERVYVAVPTGASTTNDKMLVFSPVDGYWTVWDIPAAGMTSSLPGSPTPSGLMFSYATGSNHVGLVSADSTDDDGAAIVSRYQSGLYRVADPGRTAFTRWTRVWGTGTPTVAVLVDYATSDSRAAAVTLGTSPAVAEGYHQQSYKGEWFSHKMSATSGVWSASRLAHDVAAVR